MKMGGARAAQSLVACTSLYSRARLSLTNCIFSRNLAYGPGGALLLEQTSRATITGCTFSDNQGIRGRSISCDGWASIASSILWHGDASDSPEIGTGPAGLVSLAYSDVHGGWVGAFDVEVRVPQNLVRPLPVILQEVAIQAPAPVGNTSNSIEVLLQ
jgi:hypothetical protein